MRVIVLQNQEQFGPFDLNQLQTIVNEGHFRLTDYCWAQEWSEWRLLSTVVSRIPSALQCVMPVCAEEKMDGEVAERSIVEDALPNLQQLPSVEEPTSYSTAAKNNSDLKAGMVVKNDSQSVSCDFITSLAVRGVYVKPLSKSEDVFADSTPSSVAAFHVARGEEIIGHYALPDILNYLESGHFLPTDLFWNESAGEWAELVEI